MRRPSVGGYGPAWKVPAIPQTGDIYTPWDMTDGDWDVRYDQAQGSVAANTLYVFPFFNPWPDAPIAAQEIEVQLSGVTSKYAWGVYADSGGRPLFTGGPIFATGTQTVASSTGVKSVAQSPNVKMPRGVLWCAFDTDTADGANWRLTGVKDRGNGFAIFPMPIGRTVTTQDFCDSYLTYSWTLDTNGHSLPITS